MKRIVCWFLISSITFLLGFVASLFRVKFNYSTIQNPEIISVDFSTLDYKELTNNPDKYDGKIVRVNAQLYGHIPNPRFLDENNSAREREIVVVFNNKEDWAKIIEKIQEKRPLLTMRKAEDLWDAMPKIIAVGKFSRIKPSKNINSVDYDAHLKFEVTSLEKMSHEKFP